MEKTFIAEAQGFGWWGVIPGSIAVLFGAMYLFQIILKKPIGNRPAPDWLLLVFFVLTSTFTIVLYFQNLKTSITNRAVYVNFGIFASQRIFPLADIKSISIRKYDGMNEFSGWGVKSNSNEQSYTESGNEGVEIELKSGGKKILIGTQKPVEMQKIIDQFYAK
jgi:hypothetical protein